MIVQISAHLIGTAAHRINEIKEIIAQKKDEGKMLSWEQGEAEFEKAHGQIKESHGIR